MMKLCFSALLLISAAVSGWREVIVWHEFILCYKQENSRHPTALFSSALCSSANGQGSDEE